MARLDSAIHKWQRAGHHLVSLEHEIETFGKSDPCVVATEYDPNTRQKLWRVSGHLKRPPLGLHPIIGDMFYNFRGALDHAANEVVLAAGGQLTVDSGFPIYSDRHKWKSGYINKLPGSGPMIDTLRTIVKKYQPAYGENPYTTAILANFERLSVIDKHRHFTLNTAAVDGGWFDKPVGETHICYGALDDGAVLATAVTNNPEVEFHPIYGISFGKGGPTTRELSAGIAEVVAQALEEFATTFFNFTLRLPRGAW